MRAGEGKGGLEVSGVTHRQQRAGRFVSGSGILGQKSFFCVTNTILAEILFQKFVQNCKGHKLVASSCANGRK